MKNQNYDCTRRHTRLENVAICQLFQKKSRLKSSKCILITSRTNVVLLEGAVLFLVVTQLFSFQEHDTLLLQGTTCHENLPEIRSHCTSEFGQRGSCPRRHSMSTPARTKHLTDEAQRALKNIPPFNDMK